MSGDNGEFKQEPIEARDLVLTITFKAGGGIQVVGPGSGQVYDEPLCFWMLEKAKDFIKVKNGQAMQSNLCVPDRLRRR